MDSVQRAVKFSWFSQLHLVLLWNEWKIEGDRITQNIQLFHKVLLKGSKPPLTRNRQTQIRNQLMCFLEYKLQELKNCLIKKKKTNIWASRIHAALLWEKCNASKQVCQTQDNADFIPNTIHVSNLHLLPLFWCASYSMLNANLKMSSQTRCLRLGWEKLALRF